MCVHCNHYQTITSFNFLFPAYVQQTGRAGRDGEQAQAIMYYNSSDLARSTMTPEMAEYCRLSSCRREFLASHFGTSYTPKDKSRQHTCCDNCAASCQCCSCMFEQKLKLVDLDAEDPSICTPIDPEPIRQTLNCFFDEVNAQVQGCTVIDAALMTGLTNEIADDIADNCAVLQNNDTLTVIYRNIDNNYIDGIHQILTTFNTNK